jgi:hypothetical protein
MVRKLIVRYSLILSMLGVSDTTKKFVCLHRSILSEGINVSELEAVFFLRNMDVIEMVQTYRSCATQRW